MYCSVPQFHVLRNYFIFSRWRSTSPRLLPAIV